MDEYVSRVIRRERVFEEDFTYDQIKAALLDMKVVTVRPGRAIDNRYLVQVNGEHVKTCYTIREALSFAAGIDDQVEGDERFNEPVCCVRRPLLFVHHALQPGD